MKRENYPKHDIDFINMLSRLKLCSVVKLLFASILFVGVAFVGVTASAEVVHAALGDDKNPTNQISTDGYTVGGSSMSRGIAPGMMSPMMASMPMMDEMEGEAFSSPEIALSSSGGGGANSKLNLDRGKVSKMSSRLSGKSREQIVREEGGYNPDMGNDVLNSGSKVDFDPMIETMLVRTGSIQATTCHDFDNLQSQLQATILNVHGAYIESSNNNGGWKDHHGNIQGKSIYMQVRVPVDMFFKLRDDIVSIFPKGEVGSVSDSVTDITSQYVDAAARAATLRATHAQLTKLMSYAETIDAVIKVQRELSQVTQQLEAKEATMKRLSTSASLSTLSININQKPPPPPKPDKPPSKKKWSVFNTVKRASRWLSRKLQNMVDLMIFATFALIPVTIVSTMLVFICKKIWSSGIFSKIFNSLIVSPNPSAASISTSAPSTTSSLD